MKKALAITFMLIIILSITGCQSSASPSATLGETPEQIIPWQTYSNTIYGYSISYPADWTIDYLGNENQGLRITSTDNEVNVLILADTTGNSTADEVINAMLRTVKDIEEHSDHMYAKLLSLDEIFDSFQISA